MPIDLRLGDRFGYRALVVTGPNTGGKTVSLKTLGLLALMHQAGLRVPAADGARLPVFRRVMADIGDEQSIAQSLSTFSSHLRNVVRFVADAGPATLVLLDEVGAGTDPAEGSALAMAIVSRLLDAGAMVAATTHYAELKTFATEHAGVSNAAVEFDVDDAAADLPADDRPPGQEPGVRDRRAARPAERDPRRCARADLGRARDDGGDARRHQRSRGAQSAALDAARAERDAAADERERATEAGRARRREAAELLADARRAADDHAGGRRARGGRRPARADAPAEPARGTARPATPAPSTTFSDEAARARRTPASRSRPMESRRPTPRSPPRRSRGRTLGTLRTLGSTGRIVEISGRTGRVTLETEGARLVVPGRRRGGRPRADQRPDATRPRGRGAAPARRSARHPALDLQGERVEAALERLAAISTMRCSPASTRS